MDAYDAHNYEALLNNCFEIEGLLSLMRMREEESPEEIYMLLKEKVAALADELGVLAKSEAAAEVASEDAVAASVEFEEAADADVAEPEAVAPASAPVEKAPAPVVEASVPAPAPEPEPVDIHADIPVVADDIPVVVLEDDDDEVEAVVFDNSPVVNPESVADAPAPHLDAPVAQVGEKSPVQPQVSEGVESPTVMSASLFDELSAGDDTERRDERLAREKSSGDLLSALTRNDLIRFRRELFANSPIIFTDTIHLLEAMNSYAEAEEYLYGDLHWNPDGDDVRDFMAILRNHFSMK